MKLFKKAKSSFYWFDFTVRGQRYRGSTGETKAVRATKVASVKLAQALVISVNRVPKIGVIFVINWSLLLKKE